MRTVRADPPVQTGVTDGLSWARFAPSPGSTAAPSAGVVVLPGADSVKENHFDFARACAAGGLAAIVFDARGHGASGGALDGRAVDDVARIADVLRAQSDVAAIGLRGSSMGGWFALAAAAEARAGAVVAICPAPGRGLALGIRGGRFGFAADRDAVLALLAAHDEAAAAAALGDRLLLLHADGDEVVPVAVSRALHAAAPGSRLVAVPGGHHRSIQHDPELQGVAVRFLARTLAG